MNEYDVIIIGGGPAGMMAAGRAAECGARVLLLEKNDSLGRKLLISGGGRSNITNAEFDPHVFLEKFQDAAKFLYSPLSRFGVKDVTDFFAAHGVPTKIEEGGRVFPISDNSRSVFDALSHYMRQGDVTVMPNTTVSGIETADGAISGVRLGSGDILKAGAYVLATGGTSHPETGSTGDGFVWLERIGHTIVQPRPALVPIRIRESWVHSLSGISFPEAKLTILQHGAKFAAKQGKLLFTHFGLSGPLVLNMSRDIDELLQNGEVILSLDLFPHSDIGEIDRQIQMLFDGQKNKQVKNALEGLIPPLSIPAILSIATIDPEKPVHSVKREERLALAHALKGLPMTVEGLLGEDKAIVTSGGVALAEIDFRHMRSRLYPNLYLVGDILDIDRPSGGYSLQLCWTTGFVAGTSAAGKKDGLTSQILTK